MSAGEYEGGREPGSGRPEDGKAERPSVALKLGIAGAIGLGAIVSGLLISRRGRRLVREAWQGRRRTRLEDRVLDALWGDEIVGRRNFDVQEIGDGVVALSGVVRSRRERIRALRLARHVKDVRLVKNQLVIERVPRSEHRLADLRRRRNGIRRRPQGDARPRGDSRPEVDSRPWGGSRTWGDSRPRDD
jgi:hypothetical protein